MILEARPVGAGFSEVEHFYRPSGVPIEQRPGLASVWRKVAIAGSAAAQ